VAATRAERPPRHLAAGASINVAAQVATIAAAGVTSVAVARLLGPSGTGTLALAVTLVAVSTTVFSLGLRSGVIYRVSRGAWDPSAAARAAAGSALALGAAGGLIGLGFYAVTSGSVLQGMSPAMAIATFASLPFALVWLFLAAVTLATERYEAYGAITVVQPVAQVVLAVTLAATTGTLGAVIGFAASQVVGAGAALLLVRRREAAADGGRQPGELRAAARFGLLSWGSEVLQNLNYRLDLFVLNAFAVTADVGVYSVALTVTSFAWILPSALQTVLFPRTARLDTYAEPGTSSGLTEVELAASRGTRQTVLLLIPTALALVFALIVLVPLFYGSKFDRTTELGLILVPGTLALGLARVLVAVTAGRGHPQYSLYGRLIDMPITAVLYFVLIPAHGATGAAVASSVSYALTGVISFVFFRRVVHLPLRTLLVPTREDLRDWRSAARVARRRFSRRGPAR
jgi:O-antigen/teichoic acid export membrane protein